MQLKSLGITMTMAMTLHTFFDGDEFPEYPQTIENYMLR